jgi:hypothetical protein
MENISNSGFQNYWSENLKGKIQLGRSRHEWQNIKMDDNKHDNDIDGLTSSGFPNILHILSLGTPSQTI